MRPRRTHQSTGCFDMEGGTEDNNLWFQQAEAPVAAGDPCEGLPCFITVWEPSAEERQLIAEGHNIELAVIGNDHPPVSVSITDVPLGRPPL